jgi:hypothetical protein
MVGYEAYGRTVEAVMILKIAEALRDEFGVGIDAHPGGIGTEAGVVNRAFRASACSILRTIVSPQEDLAGIVTWVLRQAALGRLVGVGIVGGRDKSLLDQEPGLGDAWVAYLALAPESVIEDLIG